MASSKVTLKKQGLSRFSLLILMLAFGTVGAFFISRSFAAQATIVSTRTHDGSIIIKACRNNDRSSVAFTITNRTSETFFKFRINDLDSTSAYTTDRVILPNGTLTMWAAFPNHRLGFTYKRWPTATGLVHAGTARTSAPTSIPLCSSR